MAFLKLTPLREQLLIRATTRHIATDFYPPVNILVTEWLLGEHPQNHYALYANPVGIIC